MHTHPSFRRKKSVKFTTVFFHPSLADWESMAFPMESLLALMKDDNNFDCLLFWAAIIMTACSTAANLSISYLTPSVLLETGLTFALGLFTYWAGVLACQAMWYHLVATNTLQCCRLQHTHTWTLLPSWSALCNHGWDFSGQLQY